MGHLRIAETESVEHDGPVNRMRRHQDVLADDVGVRGPQFSKFRQIFVAGFLRVFHFEKGAAYYFHTWTFITKLSLFIIIGLVSIIPTIAFLSWRKAVKQGQVPNVDAQRMRSLRSIIHLELAGVVLILLMEALMAKGVGLML